MLQNFQVVLILNCVTNVVCVLPSMSKLIENLTEYKLVKFKQIFE